MKKFLAICLVFCNTVIFFPTELIKADDTNYFVVTAYYSPLVNQEYYLTGDYESEIRLNGRGTNGASGKEVFSGMLAAPKTYEFGTKIYLEGLGVGEVSDRGGAIVSAGKRGYQYDRLDIWMGYGDEGLRRALYWGKRTVKGYIVSPRNEVDIDYKSVSAPDWAVSGLKNQKEDSVFSFSLGKDSNSENIKKLQEFFSNLGIYFGEIDGIYNDELIEIIYNFQIDKGIVKSESDSGAGYWGTNTRETFKKAYSNGEFITKIDNDEVSGTQENTEENRFEQTSDETDIFQIFEQTLSGIENVKKLQTFMFEMGLYSGEINGKHEDLVSFIYDFQISKGIIKSENDSGAGVFGPRTREAMKTDYKVFLEEKAKKEARKKELEQKYKEIENMAISKAEEEVKYFEGIAFGETSQRVRDFQLLLKDLGYFDEKDTAIFGEKTKEAVLNFQADNGIISRREDENAGIIEEKTIEAFKKSFVEKYINEELEKNPEILEEIL